VKLKSENIDPICYPLRLYVSCGCTDEGILCSSNFRLLCVLLPTPLVTVGIQEVNLWWETSQYLVGLVRGRSCWPVHVLDIHRLKPHQNTTSSTPNTPKLCSLSIFCTYCNQVYLFFLSIGLRRIFFLPSFDLSSFLP
jgi:hypothetical protein